MEALAQLTQEELAPPPSNSEVFGEQVEALKDGFEKVHFLPNSEPQWHPYPAQDIWLQFGGNGQSYNYAGSHCFQSCFRTKIGSTTRSKRRVGKWHSLWRKSWRQDGNDAPERSSRTWRRRRTPALITTMTMTGTKHPLFLPRQIVPPRHRRQQLHDQAMTKLTSLLHP